MICEAGGVVVLKQAVADRSAELEIHGGKRLAVGRVFREHLSPGWVR